MENLILAIVIIAILGLSIGYIVNAKRKGVKCIGCPAGGCSGSCSGHCHEGSEESCSCNGDCSGK